MRVRCTVLLLALLTSISGLEAQTGAAINSGATCQDLYSGVMFELALLATAKA